MERQGSKTTEIEYREVGIPMEPSWPKKVDNTRELPLKPHVLDVLPFVTMRDAEDRPHGTFENRYISPFHGRSCELAVKDAPFQVYFGDEFGNWYSRLNIKGNDTSDPRARITGLGHGYDINGLMTDEALLRIRYASHVLRGADIDTEWPVLISKPQYLYTPDDPAPKPTQHVREFAYDAEPVVVAEDYFPSASVKDVMKDTEFVAVVRAMKVSERLRDGSYPEEVDISGKLLECVNLHNFDVARRQRNGTYDPELFGEEIDTSLPEDEQTLKYANKVLPRRMGRNVRLMHSLGIHHGYLHPGNITMFGEIVDLDSLQGHAIMGFGPDASAHERFRDLNMLFNTRSRRRWLSNLIDTQDPDEHSKFAYEFVKSYFKTAPHTDTFEQISITQRLGAPMAYETIFDPSQIKIARLLARSLAQATLPDSDLIDVLTTGNDHSIKAVITDEVARFFQDHIDELDVSELVEKSKKLRSRTQYEPLVDLPYEDTFRRVYADLIISEYTSALISLYGPAATEEAPAS